MNQRMKRLLNSCDINRTLIGDLLIRSLICQKYKINNEEIRLKENQKQEEAEKEEQGIVFMHWNRSFYR